MRSKVSLTLSLSLLLGAAAATAEPTYWPNFRGPEWTGVAPTATPPVTWSESENLRFKVEIPGRGLASPVVWENRIYLLTAVPVEGPAEEAEGWVTKPARQRFTVLALSRDDGSVIWERVATEAIPQEGFHKSSSWASASPITDGRRLIAHFGSRGTYAYDLDGNLLWQVDLGEMTTRNGFGEGASPALWKDWVIINWDHEGDSFIVALDADTGEIRWKLPRPGEVTSWSTPLVTEQEEGVQVVIASTGRSRGYELETARELWSLGGMTVNTIPTPVERDSVVYLTSGFRGEILQAVDLERARGELEESDALLWSHEKSTPYVASPLLYRDRLYFVKVLTNVLTVLDAVSGQPVIEETRLPGLHNIYASPVAADGRVYFFDRDGHAVVLAAGDSFEVLAENSLDEGVDATPALVDGELFVRGTHHLYCFTAEGPPAEAKSAP